MSASSSSSATLCQTSPADHCGSRGPPVGGPQNLTGDCRAQSGSGRGSGPPTTHRAGNAVKAGPDMQARLPSFTCLHVQWAPHAPVSSGWGSPTGGRKGGHTRTDGQVVEWVRGPVPTGAAYLQEGAPPQLCTRDPPGPGPVHRVEDPLDDLREHGVSEPEPGWGTPRRRQGRRRDPTSPAEGARSTHMTVARGRVRAQAGGKHPGSRRAPLPRPGGPVHETDTPERRQGVGSSPERLQVLTAAFG